jgi:dCMP deaminase
LQKEQGFKRLRLARTAPTPAVEKSAAETTVPSSQDSDVGEDSQYFADPEALLSFVTANWRERWVTTDIWDQHIVEVFSRRPFFLLISVDAPVTVRWERFKKRYLYFVFQQTKTN